MENKKYIMGAFFILLSAIGFSTLQMLVKLSPEISIFNKLFFRNVVILIITYILIKINGVSLKVDKSEWKILSLRVFFGVVGVILNFYTVTQIYLADSTIIQKLSSFILLFLSYLFLKEKFTRKQFFALIFSFIGLIFVVKPVTGTFSIGYITALLAAICSAIAYLSIRIMGVRNKVNPLLIVFYFSLGTCIFTFPFIFINKFEVNFTNILILIGIGIFGALGQYGITFAYKFAASKEISIFEYSQVVISSILGIVFLNEFPDLYSLIGYVIIVGTAIYINRYNLKEIKN